MKERYTISDLMKMFNKSYQTTSGRFRSPYAKERWGVEEIRMPDGSKRRFVPKGKVFLWEEDPAYVGRPRFN